MKTLSVAISLTIVLLCMFSSMEVVLANVTIDYTLPTIWLIIIGGVVFFLALVGWMIIDWLRHQKND
jgi:hypothetical protein